MILFFVSFLLVFISSYFLTSIIAPKKSVLGLIYLFIIAFAQIVLAFEVLSLFTAIKQGWVLSANVFILIMSANVWSKKSRPLWSLDLKDFKNKVANSLKLDKSLMILYISFFVFIITSLILCSVMPITNADARSYHVVRSLFWIMQGSLSHFEYSDVRALCLPINSEILYAWLLMFVKKELFLGFFSFVGYLLSIISVYGILGFLGYCTRKKLWVIFMLSSLASVIVQVSGTETDIIIAGLVSSSIFMYWYALRNNSDKIPIFMAALAFALAVGTKTPSLMTIPAIGLFFIALSAHYLKKEFYKPLLYFLGFGFINFLIFSSYNYILNYLHFSSFFGSENFMVVSKNYYGLKGLFSNFIKYIFMFFDFTGFRWADYVSGDILNVRGAILNFLNLGSIPDGLYTSVPGVNRTLIEPLMGGGILGFLVYLPCLVWAFICPLFKLKSMKCKFNFAFAGIFIINLLVISYLIAYMSFSVRFVMFFMVLSSPILVYSYLKNKNPLKYIIVAFSVFYLVGVSTHLWARPLYSFLRVWNASHSITAFREIFVCKDYHFTSMYTESTCILRNNIQASYSPDNKIAFFSDTSDGIYSIKALEFEGYKIDFKNLEDAENIDFDDYNIIIFTQGGQKSTLVKRYEQRKNESQVIGKKLIMKKTKYPPCYYVNNPTLPKTKKGAEYPPFQVNCFLSQDFLDSEGLVPLGIAGVIFPKFLNGKKNYSKYYSIYRNVDLPVKWKN